eukprot:TRINITY_DN8061_c0_g1_i1.p2 TRINITY_DN8061_c0_g1~~TRINITY_DN8061_c0_g1_i1.p2  ORF type:complete len:242 (+),score=34.73 TRINITY_DN8061_c0_g1_i1:642-1367(+)
MSKEKNKSKEKTFSCSFMEYGANEDRPGKTIRLAVISANKFEARRFPRIPRFTMYFKTIQLSKKRDRKLYYPEFNLLQTVSGKKTKMNERVVTLNKEPINIPQNRSAKFEQSKKPKPIILKLNNIISRSIVSFEDTNCVSEECANPKSIQAATQSEGVLEDNRKEDLRRSYYENISELKQYEKRLNRINDLLNIDRSGYEVVRPSKMLVKRQSPVFNQRFFETSGLFNLKKALVRVKDSIL